ncbi:hypothetical protein PIB30_067011 [Stylosanthes scabra]|uniref:Uncharacterized protein n=1 Tax=Stylosanthes scabra TaxID=79078 RepID=A0ABU6WN47_9FABA|nr:hypothetical protein [Stylosanthes scabra]
MSFTATTEAVVDGGQPVAVAVEGGRNRVPCVQRREKHVEREKSELKEGEREISVELCHRSRASHRWHSWRKPRHRRTPPVRGKNTVVLVVPLSSSFRSLPPLEVVA